MKRLARMARSAGFKRARDRDCFFILEDRRARQVAGWRAQGTSAGVEGESDEDYNDERGGQRVRA